MGLFIHLNVQFDRIAPEQWQTLYESSLHLLKAFPAPLLRYTIEKHGSQSRRALTTNIQANAGTADEYWSVEGDLSSRKLAETYRLYRDLGHYLKKFKTNKYKEQDILWVPDDELCYASCAGNDVFDAKSQGYPYHFAMLAVSIVFETALPGRVLVTGDINQSQSEIARQWAESILEQKLDLPLICDPERLWHRLNAAYDPETSKAIERFLALCAIKSQDAWRILNQTLDDPPGQNELRSVFRSQLKTYSSLSQLGASRLIMATAEASKDISRTIEWVCGTKKNPTKFSPQDLLDTLCHVGLVTPLEDRPKLNLGSSALSNFEETFIDIFASIYGLSDSMDFILDEDFVLSEFTKIWPEQKQKFLSIIESHKDRSQKSLKRMKADLDKLGPTSLVSQRKNRRKKNASEAAGLNNNIVDRLLMEIARQRPNRDEREDVALGFGSQLSEQVKKRQDFFSHTSSEMLRARICDASMTNGLLLTELAWEAIDRHKNLEELQRLYLLSAINNHEIGFVFWRTHIFESPDLWPLLCASGH